MVSIATAVRHNKPHWNIARWQRVIDSLLKVCQEVKTRSKYINIYKGQSVYAQLHPTRTGDGIDLALRECDDDPNLPECKIVKRIGIRELKGYWKANKNWLEGDGRFTKYPAAAFFVPSELSGNPQHPGWKELEQLLKYACEKK